MQRARRRCRRREDEEEKKKDKDAREETATRRAASPDRYTNTNADTVIDKPALTTGGRTLSAVIG